MFVTDLLAYLHNVDEFSNVVWRASVCSVVQ